MRITEEMLQFRVAYLNRITKSPENPWSDKHANIGNFHLSHAYGGVSLHRVSNGNGGIDDVFKSGHMPKRELFNRLCSFIDGIEFSKN